MYASKSESIRIKNILITGILEHPSSDEQRERLLAFVKQKDMAALCLNDQESAELLGLTERCKEFQHYSWAQLASIVLLGLGALHLILIALFARFAKRSKKALLMAFKSAWASSVALSLLILLGQTALAAVTFYYFTIVFFGVYVPKLLLAMLFLGAYAFYKIGRVMFERVEPLTQEPNAEEVKEEAAPKLWARVRAIASQVGTEAPDAILIGMNTSCYVTEFPVTHAQGIARGRTLYLSAPIMQRLSADEVSSIIGHEMGHFKGEDTLMTRKLIPSLIKSDGTLCHLYEATLVGLPAFYAMLAFRNLFEEVISTHSRDRELAADACGALVTTSKIGALALVRYCFESEIHDVAMHEHMAENVTLESALLKHRSKLLEHEDFWKNLMTHGLPHPFDSHPPVSLRVEKLGFSVLDLRAEAMQPVARSAFDEWLDTRLISNAVSAHDLMVQNVQQQIAVAAASADELGKEIVAKHFPKIVLKTKPPQVTLYALKGLFFVLISLVCVCGFLLMTHMPILFLLLIPTALILGYFWLQLMRRYAHQTLTLDHRGLQLSSWTQPLAFSNIHSITFANEGIFLNHLKIILVLTDPVPKLYKYPLFLDNRKRVEVNLYIFEGSPDEMGERIVRYFQRGLT